MNSEPVKQRNKDTVVLSSDSHDILEAHLHTKYEFRVL